MEPVYIFGIIVALFFVILIARQLLPNKFKEKICGICLTVTLTWIGLLILYWNNLFENTIIISLFMGSTVLGIFYLTEKKAEKSKKELTLFRLPFLLTLFLLGYSLITLQIYEKSLLLLVVLWALFILIYVYRNNKKINSFVNKIVECCKRW